MNVSKEKWELLFKRGGTCQSERLVAQLVQNNGLIQEKKLHDYIIFIYLYSDIVQYYNTQNQAVPYNQWRTFLESDDTVILSLIEHTNIAHLKAAINKHFLALKRKKNLSIDNKYTRYLLTALEELIILINYWYKNLSNTHTVKLELYSLITHELNERITLLYKMIQMCCKKAYSEVFFNFCMLLENISKTDTPWYLLSSIVNQNTEKWSIERDIFNTLKEIFDIIFSTIHNVQNTAKEQYVTTLYNQLHKPHIALLIAFTELLAYATAHLNYIPQRHLDHYYRNVLKFNNTLAKPDSVFVHFKLKSGIPYYFLPQGYNLLAGKDQAGNDILFKTNRAITINAGQIERMHVLRCISHSHTDRASTLAICTYQPDTLHEQPIALGIAETDAERLDSNPDPLGILIASPLFYLKEGSRVIKISYKLHPAAFARLTERVTQTLGTDKPWDTFSKLLHQMIKVELTAATEWIQLPHHKIQVYLLAEQARIEIILHLSPNVPPIVALHQEVHAISYPNNVPAIRMLLRNNTNYARTAYFLEELGLEKIDLHVSVTDYRGLILQNDLGLIDNSQPFQPFGPMPKLHANFYIGSDEIFSKHLENLQLTIIWDELPTIDNGFKSYYELYPKVTNSDFKVNISYLNHRHWHPFDTQDRQEISLFSFDKNATDGIERLQHKRVITDLALHKLAITKSNTPVYTPLYGPQAPSGFLKLRLCSPTMAFGHSLYPTLVRNVLEHNAKKNKQEQPLQLNAPYTPLVKSLSINYSACESITFSKKTKEEKQADANYFLWLSPFGYKTVFPTDTSTPTFLLPNGIYEKCHIRLGIKNLHLFSLSLHIQINEKSINPQEEPAQVTWQYLSQNEWIPFQEDHIISDGTAGLTQSGIILLTIPEEAQADNTWMSPGYIWIQTTLQGSLDVFPEIRGIYTQAVTASRVLAQDTNTQPYQLPAYTITNLQPKPVEIDTVVQPFCSFGSKPAENNTAFYTRVSERLRHKHRAISAWDYERIILKKFPEVFRVKCINHSQIKDPGTPYPGSVILVVIHHVETITQKETLPKAERQLLEAIRQYIQKIASPFVHFEVTNPFYEYVQVNVEVKLKLDFEKGVFVNRLQKEIKNFLSPWLFNKGEDIKLGGIMPTSQIIDFINKRPYIEGVGNFSVLRYSGKGADLKIAKAANYDNYLKATYPWSVMVSADRHEINVVDHFDAQKKLRQGGMADMSVGKDFMVGPWKEAKEVQNQAPVTRNAPEELQESVEQYYLITKKYIKPTHYGRSQ